MKVTFFSKYYIENAKVTDLLLQYIETRPLERCIANMATIESFILYNIVHLSKVSEDQNIRSTSQHLKLRWLFNVYFNCILPHNHPHIQAAKLNF